MTAVVRGLRRVVAPLSRTRLFRRSAPHWLPPLERLAARLSGGHLQVSGILVPSLVLHSTGARTGETRDAELMYTPEPGGTVVVAGTSFARERHPGWSYNLLAHPDAEVSVRGRRFAVRAELIADPQDREATWALIQRQWPGYRAYERDSGRTIRLFRLRVTEGMFPHQPAH